METNHSTKTDDRLQVLGSRAFRLEGDVHKVVTFLNQTLKDKGYIFGVSKHPEGLALTVYRVET